jgi:hypothetical protein
MERNSKQLGKGLRRMEGNSHRVEKSKQLWQGSGNSHHRKGVQMENSNMEGRKCR